MPEVLRLLFLRLSHATGPNLPLIDPLASPRVAGSPPRCQRDANKQTLTQNKKPRKSWTRSQFLAAVPVLSAQAAKLP